MTQKTTLILPAHNEAPIIRQTLHIVVEAFRKSCPEPWGIIVVDNASTDGTTDAVKEFGDPHVRVLRLEEKGRGRAIRAGFEAAGEGVVAFTDADLPIEPHEILRGVSVIQGGSCEAVIGTRCIEGGAALKRTVLRKATSKIFQILARLIVGLRFSDSQCPLKITGERATRIMIATKEPAWWSELEFVLLLQYLHIPTRELPVVWTERYARRKSTVKVARDGFDAVRAMVRMRSSLPSTAKLLKASGI
jgi:glycosyltransferase involved in cell wall biosynthesis